MNAISQAYFFNKDNFLSAYYHKSMVLTLDTYMNKQLLLSVLAKSSDGKAH